MILEGNARGYGADLARHLLNPRDNDHVTVHSVDGFIADDLPGAFGEAEAISQATQCQKYLFSLSLNPPSEAVVSIEAFEAAIASVERKLGLTGQPRAVVFHEKHGRRHAHCVWSRIDAERLRAINLPHYKRKLMDVSRELYRSHDWEMPEGFRDRAKRDPDNYSREEAGQAQRLKRAPEAQKRLFRQCWEASDSRTSLKAALREQGYLLARGDRRGFVAVDAEGKIWSLSRWCGVKPREMRARLGPEAGLPSIEEVLAEGILLPPPERQAPGPALERARADLVARQRRERAELLKAQESRRIAALKDRRAGRPVGLQALFLRATGQHRDRLRQAAHALDLARQRDRDERQALIDRHLAERRALDRDLRARGLAPAFRGRAAPDPRQDLRLPAEETGLSRAKLLMRPGLILAEVSKTKARFDRVDVLRALARHIDDPLPLRAAADGAMASPQLIRLEDGDQPVFTTRDYCAAEDRLRGAVHSMAGSGGFGVAEPHVIDAMRVQDARMARAFGGRLSAEQRAALDHILGKRQFACTVGLAGAGKSTMLATAREAWARQGIRVHGAALAGKAADGLESASGIASRTLASLEASWDNGNAPIAKGDVLVIDEAGMIGTRQLARIAAKTREIGAKLVLVGDPEQLQPIEAGRPFRDLVARHGAARLTEIHRQRADWQRRASRDLAESRTAEAVTAYAGRGMVAHTKHGGDALDALVDAYAMDAALDGVGTSRLAFAHRRRDVHALNQAIRTALRAEGAAPPEIMLDTDTGKRAFAAGDRIVFGRNDKALGVKNGSLGTVERVSASQMMVCLDGDPPARVTFDPRRYRSFDHGYAVTIHKSQGATVDRAYVLASRSMDRHLAYVAMTRHRDDLRLYLSDRDCPYWAGPMRRPARQTERRRAGPSMG